jgi:DNA-binding CsgD family transcriptional regulator
MSTDHPRARESVQESLELFEEVGDAWGFALALGAADVFPLIRDGDPTGRGQALMEEGLARSRELEDAWLTAQRLNFLGDLARSQENDATATARYEDALTLLRGQDLTGTVPSLLHNLGYLALRRDDTRRSLRLFRESLAMFRDQGDLRGVADCLDGLAGVQVAMKQPERAAQLLGAAEALRGSAGGSIWPANVVDRERILTQVRGSLEQSKLASAWADGRLLRPEQAVAEALAEDSRSARPDGTDRFDLTPREWEVTALVAQGLTNRQIGVKLVITEGTARLHVKHVLQKLGFTSRSQIAAWAVEHGHVAAPEAS